MKPTPESITIATALREKFFVEGTFGAEEYHRYTASIEEVAEFIDSASVTLGTFQREVHEWSVKTFPVQTPESKIAHLLREVKELAAHPADPSEMADCLILLCGIAEMAGVDLLTAARAKMEVNRARQWGEPDEQGVQSHIDPS